MSLFIEYPLENKRFKDINPIICGVEECAAAHSFGPHIRRCYLIHYVLSGKGTYSVGGRVYNLSEGQFFLIYPDEITTYTADESEPWTYVWVGFTGNLANRFDRLEEPVGELPKSLFLNLLTMLQKDFPEWNNMHEEYLVTVIHRIMASLFAQTVSENHYAQRVKTLIDSSYMRDISVQSIADGMWVDRRYLSRLFKKNYNMSIKEYIISVRIDNAARFLSEGYSVGESCEMCGYKDRSNFSKMFCRKYGVWPSEYANK